MADKALLSTRELSQYLGRSLSTIYRLVENGEIPNIQRGGVGLRFPKDAIDEWLQEGFYKPRSYSGDVGRLQRAMLNATPDGDIRPLGGSSEMPKGKPKSRLNLGYGAVYQRKTKAGAIRWYLDYRSAEGSRVQKVARMAVTAGDAVQALRQEVLNVLNQQSGGKVKQIGFREFSRSYLQNYMMAKRRNWASDRFRLKKLDAYFSAYQDLREITPMKIGGFIKERQEAENTGSTINRFLALIKHMLNKAIEEGYLETNPAKNIKPFRETNRIERVLSQDEEKRLLAHSCGYLRSILVIGLNTGARLGEILRLEWRNIDLKARKINLLQTKSGKPRVVFINTPLLHELERMRSENGKSPYLFFNEQTKRPLGRVSKVFLTACKKAKVENFRIHDCRHTFISRLLEKGADVETVRSLAGHSSLAMVQRYAHSQDGMKRKAVELLNEEPEKNPEKGGVVLHPCDMGQPTQNASLPLMPPSRSISWN
jgi:excisionase family DNA binding protein